MWANALLIGSCVWAALFIFLIYSFGTLILLHTFHQFLIAFLLWGASNVAVVIFAILM